MTTDIISIGSSSLSAEINPFGAELWSLRDAKGRDLLWDGDPAWWTGRAPLLFPIIGRLPDDRFTHEGRNYELAKHGFARRRAFELVQRNASLARFRLAADAATRASYPFDFVLDAEFEVVDAELRMTVSLGNAGPEPMPAAFGFHPAFRWPLPGAGERSAHHIVFGEDESGPLRRLGAEALLTPDRLPTPVDGRRLALRDELFIADALIFEAPRSRSLRYGGQGGPSLAISWAGLPHLGIWTKPGAPYVCIEPWASLPAEAGESAALAQRQGLVVVAPGETQAFTMTVRLD